jgi:hypothetical protein
LSYAERERAQYEVLTLKIKHFEKNNFIDNAGVISPLLG